MNKFYAGIGSRETPEDVQEEMKVIASSLSKYGYTLRSGHAPGADMAFEIGCDNGQGLKEIYIPWKGFNGSDSDLLKLSYDAVEIAMKFHPAWHRLKDEGKKLMARNTYQVLGYDCKSPSEFVVCWTKDGKMQGGTAQAMRIAKFHNIPIFNLALKEDQRQLEIMIEMMEFF